VLALLFLWGLSAGGVYVAQADTLDDARQQLHEGHNAQATALLKSWVHEHPADYQAVFLLGMAYAQQEKYVKAIEMFHHVSALRPELAEPHGNLAVIYNAMGRPQSAARELEIFLERKPGDAVTHENLGDIHIKLALRNYRAALVRDKNPLLLKKYQQLLQYERLQHTGVASVPPATDQTNAAVDNSGRRPVTGRILLGAPVKSTRAGTGRLTISPATPVSEHAAMSAPGDMPQGTGVAIAQKNDTTAVQPGQQTADNAVLDALEQWRAAWAARDIPAYFNAYAADFTPVRPGSKGRRIWSLGAWKTYKIRVISNKTYIHLRLSNIRIEILGHGERARVRFLQFFDSNNYSSQDEKEIILKNGPEGWKIVQESVL